MQITDWRLYCTVLFTRIRLYYSLLITDDDVHSSTSSSRNAIGMPFPEIDHEGKGREFFSLGSYLGFMETL
jgi:hypothetical protein